MSYTGLKDIKHPNLVKVKILIPHFDGLLPAISTKRLSNFEMTLSPDASRTAQHLCSNLLDYDEKQTLHGFLHGDNYTGSQVIHSQPHQWDGQLRGNDTLR